MSTDTLKEKVIFGTKAEANNVTVSYSTDHQSIGKSVVKMIIKESSTIETGFRQIDFSTEKKMDAFRKLNKMMGSC